MYSSEPQVPTRFNSQLPQAEVNMRFAAIAAENPTIAGLTDLAIARAAMDPRVLEAELRNNMLDNELDEKDGLATGWLDLLTKNSPDASLFHEPTFEQRAAGQAVEFTPERNYANLQGITEITGRMSIIREIAVRNGQASFSKEDYELAA